MKSERVIGVTRDQVQRRRLHLPKGDVLLNDGRKLREIIGYREYLMKNVNVGDVTKKSFVEMRGWNHPPTDLLVSASVGQHPKWGWLMHISMSYADHDPTWVEIKMLREAFFPPDVDTAMMIPRKSNYVNVQEHCFHLWQCPEEWDIG